MLRVAPDKREAIPAREVDDQARRLRRVRANDLDTDVALLERLAPRDEGRQQQVGERPVVEQQRTQGVAVDRDIAHRRCHDGRHEDRLARQQIQLAQKAGRAVADDLVPGRVEDRRLALANCDERIALVPDPVQNVTNGRGPLLPECRERRQLGRRQDSANDARHLQSVPVHPRVPRAVVDDRPSCALRQTLGWRCPLKWCWWPMSTDALRS